MPRGVYDRTLTKEERAAMKSGGGKKAAKAAKPAKATAAAPKRKYTKKASLPGVAHDSMLKESAPPVKGGIGMALLRDNSYFAMQEVRANLSTLTMVADKFSDLPSIKTEVEAHVSLLGTLREKVFAEPAQETNDEPAQDAEHDEEQEAPPVAVSQTAPYQGSVPLPPPIVPVPAPVAH